MMRNAAWVTVLVVLGAKDNVAKLRAMVVRETEPVPSARATRKG